MINGLYHHELIFKILEDRKPHFVREFLDAGLCEYRQPIDKLRKQGWVLEPLEKEGRPAWQLKGKKQDLERIQKQDFFAA